MYPGDRDYLDRLCRGPRLPWTEIPRTEITGSRLICPHLPVWQCITSFSSQTPSFPSSPSLPSSLVHAAPPFVVFLTRSSASLGWPLLFLNPPYLPSSFSIHLTCSPLSQSTLPALLFLNPPYLPSSFSIHLTCPPLSQSTLPVFLFLSPPYLPSSFSIHLTCPPLFQSALPALLFLNPPYLPSSFSIHLTCPPLSNHPKTYHVQCTLIFINAQGVAWVTELYLHYNYVCQ